MEGVIRTKGLSLLSRPSNPQTKAYHPLQSLRNRSLLTKSLRTPTGSSSISLDSLKNPPKISPLCSYPTKSNLFHTHVEKTQLCRASAAVSADGGSFIEKSEKPKFLGVEILTLKKIIPLGVMFFCILFNYTILRDTKDVLVVTAKGSSAEIIPFLKTWVNLPMAVGFMLLYTKLSNVLSKEALFYSVIFPFIAFFGAFGFVLYPLSDKIHPTAFADKLLAALGPSFLGPVAILRIWSFCLFYVMAELWGSVVISVLFWGFANQITTVEEAKEFYPLFGLGANIALIFSGRTVKYFSNLRKNLGPGVDGWAISLKGMMSIVVVLGLVITGIYWGVNTFVLNDPSLPKTDRKKKKEKPKLGMKESLKVLLSSRYVRDLATLVVAYGISINLVEVTWKSKLKAQFPSPNEYSSFMGDFSTATGIATFTMMLLGRVILRKFGWGVAAMITPTVLLLTGVGFFSLLLFGEPLAPLLGSLGITPLLAAVYVGALQNIFSKSAKYSLFDPCKEMAYIPLDEDMKAHPNTTKQEKKTLSKLIDPRKLTREAALHAIHNDRLPVRSIIQVLFSEQTKLSRISEWSGSSFSWARSPSPALEAPGRCPSKREVLSQQHDMRRLKEDVARLQTQCRVLQAQIDRLGSDKKKKGIFRWSNFLFRNTVYRPIDDYEVGIERRTPMDGLKGRLVHRKGTPPRRRNSLS